MSAGESMTSYGAMYRALFSFSGANSGFVNVAACWSLMPYEAACAGRGDGEQRQERDDGNKETSHTRTGPSFGGSGNGGGCAGAGS